MTSSVASPSVAEVRRAVADRELRPFERLMRSERLSPLASVDAAEKQLTDGWKLARRIILADDSVMRTQNLAIFL